MKTKNKTISYLGWFLVWLKDEDKNLVIEQKNQKVYIWRQGTPFDIFKSYFQSKLTDYYCQFAFSSNLTEEELCKDIENILERVFAILNEEDFKFVLDISDYRFEWL